MRRAPIFTALCLAAGLSLLGAGCGSSQEVAGREVGCGDCHGNPPATGRHLSHAQDGVSCGWCHTGYTFTSVDPATHGNGVIDAIPLNGCHCNGDW